MVLMVLYINIRLKNIKMQRMQAIAAYILLKNGFLIFHGESGVLHFVQAQTVLL